MSAISEDQKRKECAYNDVLPRESFESEGLIRGGLFYADVGCDVGAYSRTRVSIREKRWFLHGKLAADWLGLRLIKVWDRIIYLAY